MPDTTSAALRAAMPSDDERTELACVMAKAALPAGAAIDFLVPRILARHTAYLSELCAGSNKACREACLVYSGNNPVADAQVNVKLARTEALLLEPVSWMKMFLSAVERHRAWCKQRALRCYVRPNVLSDVPWELVYPEMFSAFPTGPRGVTFYDYTKVAGRTVRKDYDLTFSFSGTNDELCRSELSRGQRIAVVFYLPNACRGEKKKRVCRGLPGLRQCDLVSDLTFMGERVLDGDCHDFRPLDPARSVIGLTYKVPTVEGKRKGTPDESKFVIRTTYDEASGALTVAGTPAQLGAWDVFEGEGANEVG